MAMRSPIPEELQLAVRQRCGFACTLCGCPIYEIHHIEDHAKLQSHELDNLTLLCPTHHAEATKGLLLPTTLRKSLASPFSQRTGSSSKHQFRFDGDSCTVWFGNANAASFGVAQRFSALMIDGLELVGFRLEAGVPRLFLGLFNELDRCVLAINDGYLQYAPDLWDIRLRGRVLTLRDAPRRIRLKIEFQPPDTIRIHNGLFLLHGIAVKIAPTGICCLNNGITMSFDELRTQALPHQVAMSVGHPPDGLRPGCVIAEVDRYKGVRLTQRVSDPRKHVASAQQK